MASRHAHPPVSSTSIALCGDTHAWFGASQAFGPFGEQLQPWSGPILDALEQELREERPDLVLHLGDYTCGGGVFQMPDPDFHGSLRRVHETLQGAGMAYQGLPGNHDCPYGSGDYTSCERMLGLDHRQGTTLDLPQARLILVHTQGYSPDQIQEALPGDPVFGWVAPEEVARVEAELEAAPGKPVILFTHQLLRPWTVAVPWQEYYRIQNADTLLGLMERHPQVVAVFQAHAHLYDVQRVALGGHERLFVVIPSCIQYPLGWVLLRVEAHRLDIQLRRLTSLAELQERSRQRDPYGDARGGERAWERLTFPLELTPSPRQ